MARLLGDAGLGTGVHQLSPKALQPRGRRGQILEAALPGRLLLSTGEPEPEARPRSRPSEGQEAIQATGHVKELGPQAELMARGPGWRLEGKAPER